MRFRVILWILARVDARFLKWGWDEASYFLRRSYMAAAWRADGRTDRSCWPEYGEMFPDEFPKEADHAE